MSIRTRLALLFMLILSVVLTAFSVTIYQLTKSNLLTEIDTDVRQRAAMLSLATHPYPQATTMHVPKLDVFASPDIYLQVLDQHGRVLASSGNLGNRTLPLMRDAIAADQVREARVGRTLLFVYGRAVIAHHQLLGYVLVARSPQTIYFALGSLLHILIPGVIIALIRRVGAMDPDFEAHSLERMRLEAERMARMVAQLLILARSDATVAAAYEPVLLGDIVLEVCRQRPPTDSELVLECQGMESLEGAFVWGNPDYLRQLFLILLDNAFKYTTAHGIVEVIV